jgi:hypothetical protein
MTCDSILNFVFPSHFLTGYIIFPASDHVLVKVRAHASHSFADRQLLDEFWLSEKRE